MTQKGRETELYYILDRVTEEATKGRTRVVIVINSRSSQAKRIETEVLTPIKNAIFKRNSIQDSNIQNVTLMQYGVAPTNVDDNAKKLAECLMDGDILITLGGDGTATIGVNAAFLSGKKVKYYTLPFGNFNDIARTVREARGNRVYGLEAKVDDEHFRFALCYFTVGMLAESTEIFDESKIRKKLRRKHGRLWYSLIVLFKWFMKNHHKKFIPRFYYEIDGSRTKVEKKQVSDVIILNGASMAKVLRGGDYYLGDKFLMRCASLQSLFLMSWFMLRGFFGVKGEQCRLMRLIFEEKEELQQVEIQAEGEYKRIKKMQSIEFKKTKEALQIL